MVIASKGQKPPTGGSEGSTVPYVCFRLKSYADIKAKLTSANVKLLKDDAKYKTLLGEFPEGIHFEFVEDASLATLNHDLSLVDTPTGYATNMVAES